MVDKTNGDLLDKPVVERYKGYTLVCTSHQVSEGCYLAQVSITKLGDTFKLEQTAWSELSPVHRTHKQACDWAVDAAKAWVDAH